MMTPEQVQENLKKIREGVKNGRLSRAQATALFDLLRQHDLRRASSSRCSGVTDT